MAEIQASWGYAGSMPGRPSSPATNTAWGCGLPCPTEHPASYKRGWQRTAPLERLRTPRTGAGSGGGVFWTRGITPPALEMQSQAPPSPAKSESEPGHSVHGRLSSAVTGRATRQQKQQRPSQNARALWPGRSAFWNLSQGNDRRCTQGNI